MTQTVNTPHVGVENVAGLKLISYNYTHFVMGCKENVAVLNSIHSAMSNVYSCDI